MHVSVGDKNLGKSVNLHHNLEKQAETAHYPETIIHPHDSLVFSLRRVYVK